jgi:glutamate racemase
MLKKVVVFDGGFGGELFADYVERELAVIDVIRVIAWRELEPLTKRPKDARRIAEEALAPYIGKVSLIVFANHLLSTFDLKYFKQKYPRQQFLGFSFPQTNTKRALILATKALHGSLAYHNIVHKMRAKIQTIDCDDWVPLVDDAELTKERIERDLARFKKFKPESILLAHTNFKDIRAPLIRFFGAHTIIEDGFKDTFRNLCDALGFRGLDGRKSE